MYGVSKSELLDRESDDPAVRLALAETKVIAETKEALAKAGVNVASLEEFATGKGDEKNRSKHILLVKNLPFASTEKELAQMFGKFGIEKIILPPTKTMAMVRFLFLSVCSTTNKVACSLTLSYMTSRLFSLNLLMHVQLLRRWHTSVTSKLSKVITVSV